jgi:hypothetical protein
MPRLSISLDIAANPLSFLYGTTAIYVASGLLPEFIADFSREFYKTNSGIKTFANAITHTRAGNATMVDSDGALKWGPHNLHAHSDSPADWVVKEQITVSGNTLTATSTTAAHRIYDLNISSPSGASYIHNFEVSAGTHSYVQIHDGSSSGYWANFDLSNGTVTVQTGSTASITQSGDKYICSMAFTSAVGSLLPILAIIPAANSTRNPSWTPVGTETVVLHRAWTYRSDLGGMVDNPERNDSYVPTTTSAVYMPRVGHHVWNGSAWVNEGLLHESDARTNLLTYSEAVDGTGWFDSNSTSTNLTDGALGVWDGVSVATNGELFAFLAALNVAVTTGDVLTFRVWVKAGTSGRVRITLRQTDPSNASRVRGEFGSLSSDLSSAGPITSIREEDWGNGIVAVSGTITINFTGDLQFSIGPDSAVAGETVIAYAAQLEAAPTPSSYIPTNSGSTVTRAADVLTIPAANLPWPSPEYIGPELVTNGTFDTDISGWTTVLGSASWSAGQISVARGGGNLGRVSAPITCEIGKVYRFTGYQDKGTTGSVAVTLAISSTSTVGAIAIFSSVTAGTFDIVFVATQTTHWVLLQNGSGSDGDAALFDNISVREINPLAVSIQMDGRVTYTDENAFNTASFFDWRLDANNRLQIRLDTDAGAGQVEFIQFAGGVFDVVTSDGSVISPDVFEPFNIASRHGSTFINGAVDGTASTANTTPTALADLSASSMTLANKYNGTIRTFRIWGQDIGDAGLVEATEPSLVPSLSLIFDGTENSFVVLDWSE